MKKNKKIILIIIILLTLVFSSQISSFARYSSNYVWNYYLESHGFYLVSDSLGLDKKNINTLWDGSSVTFDIKNYSNNNLITKNDIRLEIECEVLDDDPYNCTVNGTNKSKQQVVLSSNARCINGVDETDVTSLGKTDCELGGYEWRYLAVSQDYSFEVTAKDGSDINNARVKITVKSTNPYKKTLTGIYSLIRNGRETGEVSKTINDHDLYDELVITNSHETRRCVLVTFDSTKRTINNSPDMIDTTADEDNYITSFKVGINGKSNKIFRFYNKDFSSNYNQDDFVITESTGCF